MQIKLAHRRAFVGADDFMATVQHFCNSAGGHTGAHQSQHFLLAIAQSGDAALLAFPHVPDVQISPGLLTKVR